MAALIMTSASAQSTDSVDRFERESQEQQRRLRAIEDARRGQTPPVSVDRPRPAEADADISFEVKKVIVDGSKVIEPEAIRAAVRPIVGRTVSYKDVLRVVEALNQLYRDKKIVGIAFLPPQKVIDGVLRISMLDSRLGKVEVEGARSTDTGFVASFVKSEPGGIVSIEALSRDVERLRATTDLGASMDLKPGAKTGEVDARLTITEPDRPNFVASAGTDNFGAYSTGKLRGFAGLSVLSLTGRRDSLNLDFVKSKGVLTGLASYDTPIGTWGTRVRLEGSFAQSNVVQGAAAVLGIETKSYFGRGTLSQLLIADQGFRLFGVVSVQGRDGATKVSDRNVGNERYRAVTPALEAVAAFGPAAAFARVGNAFGTNEVAGGSQPYRKTTLDGVLTVSLPESFNLQLRGAGQYSPFNDPLPTSERFSLGGFNRMRGYPVDYLTGVQGIYGAAELGRSTLWSFRDFNVLARPFALVEQGQINDPIIDPQRGRMAVAGSAGIDFLSKFGSLRLAAAMPLLKNKPAIEDRPAPTFYFSFVATSF
jgi:hemolysin activation/secretion protein